MTSGGFVAKVRRAELSAVSWVGRAWFWGTVLGLLLTLSLPGTALAHVTISPDEVQPGSTQRFTIVVPTEKDLPTTGVSLEIPNGFEVVAVSSPSGGWRGAIEDGTVAWSGGEIGTEGIEITSPEGEVIPMGESQEFAFEARAPENTGAYSWPASQTYKDGSVVEWAGAADSEDPAPVVVVARVEGEDTSPHGAGHHEGTSGSGEHGEDHERRAEGQNATTSPEGGSSSPYVLLGAGVLVAAAATAGLAIARGRGRTSG